MNILDRNIGFFVIVSVYEDVIFKDVKIIGWIIVEVIILVVVVCIIGISGSSSIIVFVVILIVCSR